MENGRLQDLPSNWRSLLTRHADNIEKAVQSTALLRAGRSMATAFMVAPNLAVTASHVVSAAQLGAEMQLCFGANASACEDTLPVSKIHYKGDFEKGDDIALLELDGHSPVDHPPLPLIGRDPPPNTLIGSYAFVIGYPSRDARLPTPFIRTLIGDERVGVRRIIPGRILAFDLRNNQYTSDISTTAGTSGGPLVDLTTGSVVALSIAGEWRGGRGKFAYALQLSDKVRDMIESRLAGKADLQPEADETGADAASEGDRKVSAPDSE